MDRIGKMIKQLNDSDEKAEEIIRELIDEGVSALPQILNAIRNGPTPAHILLRQVILQISDSTMMDEMKVLLDDKNSYIRSIAYRILGRSSDQSITDKIEQYLEDDILLESDRVWAAKALGDGLHFHSLPILREQIRILDKDDAIHYYPELTLAISYAMARLGDSSALPHVLELSKEQDISVRLSALKLLRFFSGSGVFEQLKSVLVDSILEIRKDALDAFFLLGTKSATYCIWKLCKDENQVIAQHARKRFAQITGTEIQDEDLIKDFNKYLDDKGIEINNKVCFRSGYPINVQSLVKSIIDSKPSVDLLDELFAITGNRFGHDPEIWIYANPPDYSSLVSSWLVENGSKYSIGSLNKLGFAQSFAPMLE
ncbi:HEAT repeat domain-containing protein [Ruminiclostridium papyrosolvens]|uniref:PBS lyase n=1 Tax=Ruminiclostridium papyrosolvens C7 TaxID=1330534 RepID=U4QZW9_9FIRM|nr:HEAT repeat domain-containing protein [Ruminiclostridium papyrosolvens]EPR10529.1 hypothetical protein L323_13135 [Ruminiclostridium papyrosolvens C7]